MKRFAVRDYFDEEYNEFIIGTRATGKHTVYLVFGEVREGERRPVAPNGHDEILFLLSGRAVLEGGGTRAELNKEDAVSMEPDERFTLTALTDCAYVVAGAHPPGHGH